MCKVGRKGRAGGAGGALGLVPGREEGGLG